MFSGWKDFHTYFFLQVEKDQKFIPYVWTVVVSSFSRWWRLNFLANLPFPFLGKLKCLSFKWPIYFSFLSLSHTFPFTYCFVLCRGGTMNTFPGIQNSFVELIMFPFLRRFCGSRISLLKKCMSECNCLVHEHTHTHTLIFLNYK